MMYNQVKAGDFMNFETLKNLSSEFLLNSKENFVEEGDALRPDLAGMQIYDAPIFAVADADDPLFSKLREPEVVGEGAFLPSDWLEGASSVLSFSCCKYS